MKILNIISILLLSIINSTYANTATLPDCPTDSNVLNTLGQNLIFIDFSLDKLNFYQSNPIKISNQCFIATAESSANNSATVVQNDYHNLSFKTSSNDGSLKSCVYSTASLTHPDLAIPLAIIFAYNPVNNFCEKQNTNTIQMLAKAKNTSIA